MNIKRNAKLQSGQAFAEYMYIIAIVAIGTIAVAWIMNSGIQAWYFEVEDCVDDQQCETVDNLTTDEDAPVEEVVEEAVEEELTEEEIVAACPPDLDFDSLAAGTVLADQFEGISISTNRSHGVMVFDSTNPTGGDDDLGTPNEVFGGPGVGPGGESGTGENSVALGNVIIISEDGDSSDPDDEGNGGKIFFNFDNPTNVSYIYFLDQDNDGRAANVTLTDGDGNEIASEDVVVPNENGANHYGDNGVYKVDLDATGVRNMTVTLPGSGAIASLFFCE